MQTAADLLPFSLQRPGLLSAKIRIPEPGERIVQRERLLTQVSTVLKSANLWIGAPAGAGKTVLAASFASRTSMPVFWYEFDPVDTDLASFFLTFVQAFRHAFISSDAVSSLPILLPEDMLALPVFAHRFFRKLFEQLSGRWLLILDNCQEIPDSSSLFKLFTICLKELPVHCRAVLLSRLPPPPDFIRLKVSGKLQELDRDRLCFTRQEIGEVMDMHGIAQEKEESCIDYLQQATAGWAAGLTLLLKEQNRDICSPEMGEELDRQELFDYFTGVIFDGLPEKERELLMVAALMPDIRPDVLDLLQNRSGGRKHFQLLSRNNFFTYALDNRGKLFQFHPLFKEFLLKKADELLPASDLCGYLEKGAEILIGEGRTGEGIKLLHHAGNFKRIIELIHNTGAAMLEQGHFQTLLNWQQFLPRDLVNQDPWLLFFFGSAKMHLAPVDAIEVLKSSFTLFKNQENMEGAVLTSASLTSSIVNYLSGLSALDPFLDFLEEQLDPHIFPTDCSPENINISNAIFRAMVVRRPAHPDIDTWLELIIKQGSMDAVIILHYLWTGRFIKARAALNRLSVYKEQIISTLKLSGIDAMEVQYYLIMDDPDNCCRIIEEAAQRMEKTGIRIWESHLYILGAGCCMNSGNVQKAAHYLKKVEKNIEGLRLLDRSYYHVVKTLEALLAGDLSAADIHQQSALDLSVIIGMPSYETWCRYGAALVAVFQDKYAIARNRFDRVLEMAASPGNPWFICQAHLGLAYMYLRKGDRQQASKHLRQGFVLARRKNYLSFFLFIPEMMTELAALALEEEIEPDFVCRFIRRRQLLFKPPSIHLSSWPWPLKIYTLGQFEIFSHDEPLRLSAKTPVKPLELLKYLVCSRGQKITREAVADRLWPESDGDRALQNLNTTLHRLRKLLCLDQAVIMEKGRLFLNTDLCWVDCWYFEELIQQAGVQTDSALSADLTGKALSLYKGSFDLSQGYNSVLVGYSEQLKNTWAGVVVKQGKELVTTGRTGEALDLLQHALGKDNSVEQFYLLMMTVYYDQRRMKEAVAVYSRCRMALAELGMVPDSRTRALYGKCTTSQANRKS